MEARVVAREVEKGVALEIKRAVAPEEELAG